MDLTKIFTEALQSGSTMDDIAKAINDAQRIVDAEKVRNEKLSAIKNDISECFVNYLTELLGEPLTKEEMEAYKSQMFEGLAEVEELVNRYKPLSKKDEKDKEKSKTFVKVEKNGKRDKKSEDILKKYLDDLFK